MGAHARWAALAADLVPALGNHLWQSTVFAGVVFLLALALGRAPARLRHWLWLIALGKFAVPASLVALLLAPLMHAVAGGTRTLDVSVPPAVADFAAPMARLSSASPGNVPSASRRHDETVCVLGVIWVGGAVALAGRWGGRVFRFGRTLRTARPAGGRETGAVERVRAELRLRAPVAVLVGPDITSPGVWGVVRPVVALPEGLPASITGDELEAVLMHELVHVARRDNLIALLQMALCCAFWLHPLVWLIDRRLLAERELACDEAVVAARGESQTYAAGLVKVVRFCLGWRVVGVSYATNADLKARLQRMVAGMPDLRTRGSHRLALVAAMAVLILGSVSAVLLAASREAARLQFERRGEYLARNLAFNAIFGVLIEDERQLDKLVQGLVSLPGVAGVRVLNRNGRVLARAGEVAAEDPAVTVFRARVIDTAKSAPDEDYRGAVEIALRHEGRSLADERELRGRAIADDLAFNGIFGVLIEDRIELNKLAESAIRSGPDVAGVVFRNVKGRVLARQGEVWNSVTAGQAVTDEGTPIVVFRASIADQAKGENRDATIFTKEIRGEVEVALRESR